MALTKAALKEQSREAKGKKELNVVDQIVADLSRPEVPKPRAARTGFSFMQLMFFSAILWVGLVIVVAAGGSLGFGSATVLLLLTPLVMVIWAGFLRVLGWFM